MKLVDKLLFLFLAVGCAHGGNFDYRAGECREHDIDKLKVEFGLAGPTPSYLHCQQQQQAKLAEEAAQQAEMERLKNDPEYRKKMAEEEKKRLLFIARQKRATQPGTTIKEFIFCFGPPNTEELVNGDKILWYDKETPMFITFRNGKLTSMVIDRQTIRDRESASMQAAQMAQNERHHRAAIAESEANRNQAIWMNMINNQPKTTNCRKDYFGNVSCTTY
jgi:predicted ATP-dependent protease